MFKLALLLWIVLGTTLAGVAMAVIVSVPHLLDDGTRIIPIACGAGFVLAVPLAYLMAVQIAGGERKA